MNWLFIHDDFYSTAFLKKDSLKCLIYDFYKGSCLPVRDLGGLQPRGQPLPNLSPQQRRAPLPAGDTQPTALPGHQAVSAHQRRRLQGSIATISNTIRYRTDIFDIKSK